MKQLNLNKVTFEEVKEIASNFFKDGLQSNIEMGEYNLTPSIIVKLFTKEQMSEFLKDNPEYHPETESYMFNFNAIMGDFSLDWADTYLYELTDDENYQFVLIAC